MLLRIFLYRPSSYLFFLLFSIDLLASLAHSFSFYISVFLYLYAFRWFVTFSFYTKKQNDFRSAMLVRAFLPFSVNVISCFVSRRNHYIVRMKALSIQGLNWIHASSHPMFFSICLIRNTLHESTDSHGNLHRKYWKIMFREVLSNNFFIINTF